jgi:hypothetical protein
MKRIARAVWGLVLIFFLVGGTSMLLLFSLPFDRLKPLANALARDGNFQSLTPALYSQVNVPLRLVGLVFLLAGIAMWLKKGRTQAWTYAFLPWLAGYLRTVWADLRSLAHALNLANLSKWHLYILLGITLLGLLFRAEQLNGPVYHDEAFTFVDYASHPVATIITDYSLPNNHVFHTLLVHVAYLIFGDEPWAIRLPAFLAGVLMIPATYLLARMLYGKTAALLSAALLAPVPDLINYSASARGYTLVALFSLLTFALGIYLSKHKNQAGWLLLVILSSLGFYTIPTMLYPFGILFTWLIFTAFRQPATAGYGSPLNFLKYVLAAGLATFALTMALYTPIFVYSGIGSVFSNSFVQPNSFQEFFHNELLSNIVGTWEAWIAGLPPVGWVFLAGFILSLVYHRSLSSVRIPIQLAAIVFPAVDLTIQRPDSAPRVWLFLLPLFLIWASAGLIAPFRKVRLFPRHADRSFVGSLRLSQVIMALGVVGAVGLGVANAIVYYPQFKHPQSLEETTALYLKSQLQPGDVIAISSPYDMAVIYYLDYYGVPKSDTKGISSQHFDRVLAAVYPGAGQTLESVLVWTKIDPQKIDLASARLLSTVGGALIYECWPAP